MTGGNPDAAARIRESFARQSAMTTIGATLGSVAPGAIEIILPVSDAIMQQHGFVHGGIVATIADSAAGYAALSLLPPGVEVLTTEFKINFLAPASGDRLVARGRVVKSGRTLTLAVADVFACAQGIEKHCAFLTATLMSGPRRDGR